jgi:large subunit ribosomal protein L10
MNKQEKAREIEYLSSELGGGASTFVLSPHGLTGNQVAVLRKKLRATSSKYRVVKNRLVLRALKGTPLADVSEHLKGSTAFAYSEGDPVGLAKAIEEFAKSNKGLQIKGGYVEGRLIGAAEVQALATIPTRPVLLARFLGALNAPMSRLLSVMSAPARDLVRVLDAIREKKSSAAQGSSESSPTTEGDDQK